MYKTGDKFIIEIDSVMTNKKGELYGIKGFNSLTFDENGLDRLKPFSEFDVKADILESAEKEGYEKGLSDAWEFIEKTNKNSVQTNEEIFGSAHIKGVVQRITLKKAIEKLKTWEERQEIKVGDVVEIGSCGRAVVMHIYDNRLFDCNMLYDLQGCTVTDKNVIKKTGKHIDLTEIFKGSEGEND